MREARGERREARDGRREAKGGRREARGERREARDGRREDICRFPAALDAVIAAKGAKVEHLDNRTGRRESKPYVPPRCAAVEELLQARFERFDPTPVAADGHLPPKKRRRDT